MAEPKLPLNTNRDDVDIDVAGSSPTKTDPNARPECFRSTAQECLFVLSVTMAVAMSSFLTGSVGVISSFAGRDLGMTTSEITWMNAASSLASGSLLLPFGALSDLLPRKPLFLVSTGLFAIFCLGAGFSNTGPTLDILNGILGIWCASAVPPAQGMLGRIYPVPSKRKNRAFASFAAGNPLGFVFGAIAAGAISSSWGWRSAFWLIAAVYAGITIIAIFTVPGEDEGARKKTTWDLSTLKRFDLVGTGLVMGGIGMFCAGLSLGGEAPHGWKTAYVLVLLILGLVFIAAFIIWEIKYPYAMIPMNIWKDRDFSLLLLILSLGMLAFSAFAFWIALYFQNVLHLNSLMTGVHMLPMVVMGIAINVIAALILHKVSNTLLMYIGALAFTIAFLLAALNRAGYSYWALTFPALCLCVVGADFEFNVVNMYVLSSLPLHRQSIAGSLLQTVARLMTAIAMGVGTAIFNGVIDAPAKKGYFKHNPAEPYAAVFAFAAGISAVGVVACVGLRLGTQGHKGDEGGIGGKGRDGSGEKGGVIGEKEEKGEGDEESGLARRGGGRGNEKEIS